MDDGDVSRRDVCRGALRASIPLTSIAGGAALAGTAAALHSSYQDDDTVLSFDVETLERYRPKLVMSQDARSRLLGLFGLVARNDNRDTDVCVYWCKYSHQTGVTSFDSHLGDHEPVVVFIDSETGEVDEVVASVYHWLAGRSSTPLLDDDHPMLRVIDPWHQYTVAERPGALFEVRDLTENIDAWLANGLEEDLAFGAVHDPWIMQERDHWWQDTVGDISLNAIYVSAWQAVGRGEAGEL